MRPGTATNGSTQNEHATPEMVLEELWSGALNVDILSLGLEDNFFSLHGSSITAVKLIAAARKQGTHFTYVDLFRTSTLNQLDKFVSLIPKELEMPYEPFSLLGPSEKHLALKDAAEQCEVAKDRIEDIYPLLPQQQVLWVITLIVPGKQVAQCMLKLKREVDVDVLCDALETVVQNLTTSRTRFIQWQLRILQVVVREPVTWKKSTSLEEYLQQDIKVPFDFGKPLTRFALITAANQRRTCNRVDITTCLK